MGFTRRFRKRSQSGRVHMPNHPAELKAGGRRRRRGGSRRRTGRRRSLRLFKLGGSRRRLAGSRRRRAGSRRRR